MNAVAVRATVAIATVLFLVYQGWQWPWALMFLGWTYQGIRSGTVFLVEPVEKEKNPLTFWAIAMLWLGTCLLMFVSDLLPLLN